MAEDSTSGRSRRSAATPPPPSSSSSSRITRAAAAAAVSREAGSGLPDDPPRDVEEESSKKRSMSRVARTSTVSSSTKAASAKNPARAFKGSRSPAAAAPASSSSWKKRRLLQFEDQEKEGDSDKAMDETEPEQEEEEEEMSSSSSSSSEEESYSEDEVAAHRASARKKKQSSPQQARPASRGGHALGRHPARGGGPAAAAPAVRFDVDAFLAPSKPPSSNRSAPSARSGLAALAKKVLHRTETPETSLLAALVRVATTGAAAGGGGGGRGRHAGGRGAAAASASAAPSLVELQHSSPALAKLARKVLMEHRVDANRAEVRLLNLIFRSVGGSYENLLQAGKIDLDQIDYDEWEKLAADLCLDMEATPADLVPLCADPRGAVHAAASLSSATTGTSKRALHEQVARTYRDAYAAFWYHLGVALVADNSSAAPSRSHGGDKVNSDEKDSDSDDEDSDEEDPGRRSPMEAARDVLHRIVEVTGIGQPDVRSAAVLAIYQMGVAMLERVRELERKLDIAERQLKVANRTKSVRKASALKSQIDAYSRSFTELDGLVGDAIVKSVFLERFKDRDPHIRALSLETMSRYTLIRPASYLNGSFLKYNGWMLRDKDPAVRASALDALAAPLRSNAEINEDMDTDPMNSVFDKFLNDIVSRSRDVDATVQERAMELLVLLLRAGFLDGNSADDPLWVQVNLRALDANTTPQVRRHALYFVLEQLEAFSTLDGGEPATESSAVALLNDLTSWVAHILSDSTVPVEHVRYEHVDLVVHSLRGMEEHKHLTRNWTALLRALETDEMFVNDARTKLMAVKQRVVLRMLACSAEIEGQVASSGGFMTDHLDPYLLAALRSGTQDLEVPRPSKSKKARVEDSTFEALTDVLLQKLPYLLVTFKGDGSILQSLTSLPQYLLPRQFGQSSKKTEFLQLLRRISDVFLESADTVVLNNCAKVLVAMAQLEHARSADALLQLKKTSRELRDRALQLLDEKTALKEQSPDDDGALYDLQCSLCLCIKRLHSLSSRFDLMTTLSNSISTGLGKLCDLIGEDMTADMTARSIDENGNLPETWTDCEPKLHQAVADTVKEGLWFLLKVVAFRLKEAEDKEAESSNVFSSPDLDSHEVVVMRHRLLKLLSVCFGLHADRVNDETDLQFSPQYENFAFRLKDVATQVFHNMKSLFPAAWEDAVSPLLRECAINVERKETLAFAVGNASLRFFFSNEGTLRANGAADEEDRSVVNHFLDTVSRGCLASSPIWPRYEAAAVLYHLDGSGQEAHSHVLDMSRLMKKLNSRRLLESQWVCLRGGFGKWIEEEPYLDSDHPTEEELDEFYEDQKQHELQRNSLLALASRLANTLGVGRLSTPDLEEHLRRMMLCSFKFAFSTERDEEETIGKRLGIFSLLSKYTTFVRQMRDKEAQQNIRDEFHHAEAKFRRIVNIDEIDDASRIALLEFRKALGLKAWNWTRSPPGSTSRVTEDEESDGNTSRGAQISVASRKSCRSQMSRRTNTSEDTRVDDGSYGGDDATAHGLRSQGFAGTRSSLGGRSLTTHDRHDYDSDAIDTHKPNTQESKGGVSRRSFTTHDADDEDSDGIDTYKTKSQDSKGETSRRSVTTQYEEESSAMEPSKSKAQKSKGGTSRRSSTELEWYDDESNDEKEVSTYRSITQGSKSVASGATARGRSTRRGHENKPPLVQRHRQGSSSDDDDESSQSSVDDGGRSSRKQRASTGSSTISRGDSTAARVLARMDAISQQVLSQATGGSTDDGDGSSEEGLPLSRGRRSGNRYNAHRYSRASADDSA